MSQPFHRVALFRNRIEAKVGRKALVMALASFGSLAATPVMAADEADNGAAKTPDEIIVTAQKRSERLQDIPTSVAVVTGDAVQKQNVTDLSDINRLVPSVEIKGTFNGRVPYGMRGISTNANEGTIGLTSGVSVQVDGVPVPADAFAANNVSDVAQVEVLRGPQATLGGRTASAGVINFVTRGPADHMTGNLSAFVTDDGEHRLEGYVAGPLSDTLSFSLTGFETKTPYPIHNLTLNEQSKSSASGIRAKLKFTPSAAFDATLMGHYALMKSHGETFVPVYLTKDAALFPFIPYSFDSNGVPTFYGIPQNIAYPGFTIERGNTDYASPVQMGSRYQDWDGSLTMNYHAGNVTFSSLTAYFKEKQFQSQDIFESNVYFFDVLTGGHAPHFGNMQTSDGKVTQFTQEFKVASDASLPVNFLAGAYYSNSKVSQFSLRTWVANPTARQNDITTESAAIYGRVTAKLTDQFSVVAGLRYNHDKLHWQRETFYDPSKNYLEDCVTTSAGKQGCAWDLKDSAENLVGDISLQYHPSRDAMFYASFVRGYKPRAFNTVHGFESLQSSPSAEDLVFTHPVKQETISHFEIGAKSSFPGSGLSLNVSAFYTDYKNYQAQIFDNSQVIAVLNLANAGASTKGVEAELNWHDANDTLSLSAAYIDAKFKDFTGAECYPTQTVAQGCVNGVQDLSGKPMPASPKFKMNVFAEHVFNLSALNVILGSNLSYRSSTLFQADGNPQTRQGAFALLDASVGFQSPDEKYTLTFFVNNLTDHFYYTNMEDFFSSALGSASVPSGAVTLSNFVIGQPARNAGRYFGARVNVQF